VDNLGKKIHWIKVQIKCNGELAEALAEVLGRFVSNGIVIESITQFNPRMHENQPTGRVAVSGYLAVDQYLEEKQHHLEEALWHLSQITPIPKPEYTPIQDQDWMAAWKAHYNPIQIGERMLILPAWKEAEVDERRLVIRINPTMAFGTGTHPTTQLSLQLMERHLKPGGDVIDVGCGSGILSIAALKLGAAHTLAVDIDNQAITSTQENAGLNEISPAILETGKGSVEEILTGRFTIQQAPLVLVNILAPIIIRLFDQGLAELVCDEGKILLSGILDHQKDDVIQMAEKAGFSLKEHLTETDWVGLAMIKKDAEQK
jgi:ribosomal protein L11 methyltransferase